MTVWKKYKLGDIVSHKKGNAFKSSEYAEEGRPIVKVSNLTSSSIEMRNCSCIDESKAIQYSEYELSKGDVIVATVGSWPSNPQSVVGKVVVVPSSCQGYLLNQNAVRLRANTGINQTYLFYVLKWKEFFSHIIAGAQGSANQASVTLKHIFNFAIQVPDASTQKTIAEILSSLDHKIELNNEINQNLEALAQAVFKRWFVDFEFPNENGQPYRSSGGEMMESELGLIPKTWRIGTLADVIEFNPTEKIASNAEVPYLDMASLPTQGSWPKKPVHRVFGSGMKFRNGDTLFARITPCLENGKTCLIQCLNEGEIGWGSTEFVVMRPKGNWPKEVAYLIARDTKFRQYAIQRMTGTSGRQRVQASQLAEYDFVYPIHDRVLGQFKELIHSFFALIKTNSGESEMLASLRDSLLPKLISGELLVENIQEVNEEV